jgi:hypothetical protein
MKGEYNDSNEWIYAAYLKIQRSESGRSARHVRCEPGGGGGGEHPRGVYPRPTHLFGAQNSGGNIFGGRGIASCSTKITVNICFEVPQQYEGGTFKW